MLFLPCLRGSSEVYELTVKYFPLLMQAQTRSQRRTVNIIRYHLGLEMLVAIVPEIYPNHLLRDPWLLPRDCGGYIDLDPRLR